MASDASTIVILPTPWLKEGSWLERLYEELLHIGVLANVEEATSVSVEKDLLYNVISWRCTKFNENRCPVVIITLDNKAILVKITHYAADKFVELYDFEKALIEEIKGMLQYSECVARYGYDYC